MDFYDRAGKMALGSRLRRLSESMTEQAALIYELYHIELQPKWFPVYYALADGGEKSITQIALEIGHSHPSVSKTVKEMIKAGLIERGSNKADLRTNYIRLTKDGILINEKIKTQYIDVNNAVENALNQSQHNIWKAIEEWEILLKKKDLITRVKDEKRNREAKDIQIISYRDEHKQAFKKLNEHWITRFFKMEEADYKILDHPREYILDNGGFILMALYKGKVAGTCALLNSGEQVFELAKMAVSDDLKGRGVGIMLGEAAIRKAKESGAKKLYLESNTLLQPAINLYHKLGFNMASGIPSPYQRCNIQMEINF